MKTRVITAVVALAIFIPILYVGGYWIDFASAVLGLVALSEVFIMRKKIIVSLEAFIGALGVLVMILPDSFFNFVPQNLGRIDMLGIIIALLLVLTVTTKNKTSYDDIGVTALSIIYIGTGFHYLAAIRNKEGFALLMFSLLIVWLTDSGAYMGGRAFGKHKLWPAISPNKTWEGSITGVIVAMIFAVIYTHFVPLGHGVPMMLLIAFVMSVWGQIGDLVESALKRYYGVKDSGKILPGHGGILDRFDSLLFVLPLVHWIGLV